jgi:O-antigen ligase
MNNEMMERFFERGTLVLVLAILVFAPLAMGAVGAREFLVIQGLTVAVMFWWGLRIAFSRKVRLFFPPLCWVVLAFALYALARYFTADLEYVARQEMMETLLYAFIFFAIVNNLTSKESPEIVSLTLVFLAAGISGYAIWQYLTHTFHVWNYISPYPGRASGTYISPNNFSCLLEMTLPLAVAFLLVGRVKLLTRILVGYAALTMVAGLAVSFSRGGWVAAAVGLFALLAALICHRKHRLPALVLLLALIAGGTFFVSDFLSTTLSYTHRVGDLKIDKHIDLEFRSELWTAAEKMWADHFWFGVGPAHYDYRFRQYRPESVQLSPDRAHNDYLNLLADWGTTGGIIVAAGMLALIFSLAKTWKAVRPEEVFGRGMSSRFAFFIGAAAALLALAVHSVIDFNLHIPANALIGVTLLALLASQLRYATDNFRIEARAPLKILVIALLVGGMAYFSYQGYWRAQETIWLARGDNPDLPLLERAGFLEKAFAAEPKNFETSRQIGELYRLQSFQGDHDYETLAQTAMTWYARGMKLDPFDGYNYLYTGMCLDWLGRFNESTPDYNRAEALDPNGYYTADNIGWHYIQVGDYPAARVYFTRSLRLHWDDNVIAQNYWDMVQDKLTENASGQAPLLPGF